MEAPTPSLVITYSADEKRELKARLEKQLYFEGTSILLGKTGEISDATEFVTQGNYFGLLLHVDECTRENRAQLTGRIKAHLHDGLYSSRYGQHPTFHYKREQEFERRLRQNPTHDPKQLEQLKIQVRQQVEETIVKETCDKLLDCAERLRGGERYKAGNAVKATYLAPILDSIANNYPHEGELFLRKRPHTNAKEIFIYFDNNPTYITNGGKADAHRILIRATRRMDAINDTIGEELIHCADMNLGAASTNLYTRTTMRQLLENKLPPAYNVGTSADKSALLSVPDHPRITAHLSRIRNPFPAEKDWEKLRKGLTISMRDHLQALLTNLQQEATVSHDIYAPKRQEFYDKGQKISIATEILAKNFKKILAFASSHASETNQYDLTAMLADIYPDIGRPLAIYQGLRDEKLMNFRASCPRQDCLVPPVSDSDPVFWHGKNRNHWARANAWENHLIATEKHIKETDLTSR
jgi:hypothetical protein